MPNVRVRCISKSVSPEGGEIITHIGGTGWKWPVNQVIDSIEKKSNSFFIVVGDEQRQLTVLQSSGTKILSVETNPSLLSKLPECVD